MRAEHVRYLVCTKCQCSLRRASTDGGAEEWLEQDTLRCPKCDAEVPVVKGIPRFVPAQNYATGFGLQWNRHARTQLDSHTGLPLSEDRFFSTTQWPRDLAGETVLEVGSGAGRFTEQIMRTGVDAVSLDYSDAVEANQANQGRKPNLLLVQGDVYRMPFAPASFDRVVCLGVLQHTPDPRRAFLELPRFLKPGGHLTIDIYRRYPWRTHLTITKYWARPWTRRLKPETLYRWVNAYVRGLWPVARWINRLPGGRKLNWRLLIADYRGMYPLSENLLREWAILDTFDMLAPAYDSPQTIETVQRWFAEAGLTEVQVETNRYSVVVGRGRKPR